MSYGYFNPAELASLVDDQTTLALMLTTIGRISAAPQRGAVVNYDVPNSETDPGGFWAAVAPLTNDAGLCYLEALYGFVMQLPADQAASLAIINNWSSVNKYVTGYDGPLSMAELGVAFTLADAINPVKSPTLSGWLRSVYLPTVDSIKTRPNNWACWGAFGAIAARYHLGQPLAGDVANLEHIIATQIAPDGSLPAEKARGASGLWYTYFALAPMCAAAHIVRNAGLVDLFPGNVELALNALLEWTLNPGPGIVAPTASDPWPADLFAAMAREGLPNSAAYATYGETKRPIVYVSHHIAWPTPELAP